jgi:adenosine deaminase
MIEAFRPQLAGMTGSTMQGDPPAYVEGTAGWFADNVKWRIPSGAVISARSTGIEARIILCTLRFFSEAQSLETVHLVEDFAGTYVAGFDIAADRPGNVFDDHLAAFQYARDKGIPYTAHAGETRGPGNVWDTVRHFAPSRLGHGVPCLERPALVEHLRQHRIHLKVCPTSNIQANTFDTYPDHPIDKLYRAGISVGVNTDARTISNITLGQEYAKLHHTFRVGSPGHFPGQSECTRSGVHRG